MAPSPLTTYLNDHLAGSTGAIELMEHAIVRDEGDPLARFLSDLLPEIRADQDVLREILLRVGGEPSTAKKAVAWLGEQLSRVKRDAPGTSDGREAALGRLTEFEIVALGILGKRGLWTALRQIAGADARLTGVDFPRLIQRAEHQFTLVEHQRLLLAESALIASGSEAHSANG